MDLLQVENKTQLVSQYKRLRAAALRLNHKLVGLLTKEVMNDGGKKLGILHKGVLVFNSEDEAPILMDYCIHNVKRNGRNAIEQFLAASSPGADSDEMTCLRAMQAAWYSLFVVESVEAGLGVVLRDLNSGQRTFVIDLGFATSAVPGLVLASRILPFDDFSMSGGAALPLSVMPLAEVETRTQDLLSVLDPGSDPADLICAMLEMGCSNQVQYRDAASGGASRKPRSAPQPITASRNDLCPCGSGKKFKKCCLRSA